MDPITVDLSLTWLLAGALLAVGLAGIVVLPWRTAQVSAAARAWSDLSVLSGGFARDGVRVARRALTRLGEVSGRRPSAALTRTLS